MGREALLCAINNNAEGARVDEKVLQVEFTELAFDWIEAPASSGKLGTEIGINADVFPVVVQRLFLPGKTKDFHFVLEVQQLNHDGPRAGTGVLPGSR